MSQQLEAGIGSQVSEVSKRIRNSFGIDPVKQEGRVTVKTGTRTYIAIYEATGPSSITTVYRSDKTNGALDVYQVTEGEFSSVRVAGVGLENTDDTDVPLVGIKKTVDMLDVFDSEKQQSH